MIVLAITIKGYGNHNGSHDDDNYNGTVAIVVHNIIAQNESQNQINNEEVQQFLAQLLSY